MPTSLRLRPAVRVALVDPDDRVLMVRWAFPDRAGAWGLPGGGIEPGESHADAVRRELLEEVGHHLADPGPCVAHRTQVYGIGGGYDGQEEWFYLARVQRFTPRGELSDEELAAENVVEVRWMTLDELAAIPVDGPVRFHDGAADLLARLAREGHPPAMLELPF